MSPPVLNAVRGASSEENERNGCVDCDHTTAEPIGHGATVFPRNAIHQFTYRHNETLLTRNSLHALHTQWIEYGLLVSFTT